MPIKRLLLSPKDVTPSCASVDVVGVFNPGAVRVDGEVILLVRVAEQPRDQEEGWVGLPRWNAAGTLVIDWIRENAISRIDARVVRLKSNGLVRLTSTSHLRVARCGNGGRAVLDIGAPILLPGGACDEYGVEDPRITTYGDRCYITYVSVSRHGPATSLASTTDFRAYERHGMIFCPENKDVTLFPEKIRGEFMALHRPMCATRFTRPEMWIASSPDLLHWGNHRPVAVPLTDWQSGRIGGGAPPFRIPDGWVTIYHGNRLPVRRGDVGVYCGGAALLAPDDPTRVIRFLAVPCLTPELDFEMQGFVPNVVFPTGTVQDGEVLLIYYGAADACTAVVEIRVQELLDAMTTCDNGSGSS